MTEVSNSLNKSQTKPTTSSLQAKRCVCVGIFNSSKLLLGLVLHQHVNSSSADIFKSKHLAMHEADATWPTGPTALDIA